MKDDNVRVFARAYSYAHGAITDSNYRINKQVTSSIIYKFLRAKYSDYLTHYIDGSTTIQRHRHAEYYELIENPYAYMNDISKDVISIFTKAGISPSSSTVKLTTVIDVHVEIIDKSIAMPATPIYLIGNTRSILLTDPDKKLTVGKKTLILTNPVISYNSYFKIVANKKIRVLNLEPLFPRLTSKLQVCPRNLTQSYASAKPEENSCISYTEENVKYWKDLETDQVVKGIKLKESIDSVKIELPAFNLISANENQSIINWNQTQMDFYVKLAFNNFDKMIQVN